MTWSTVLITCFIMTISGPIFILKERKIWFQCYYSCRLIQFLIVCDDISVLFQLEGNVAAGLLAKPRSGWGPHCYDSSQWVSPGEILGLHAWDFPQEDEATLTHLCKSLVWKLRLWILTSLQMFALKKKTKPKNLSQRQFFSGAWSE